MCGIFAYLGPENPLKTCMKGLKGVESRGYDSAGVAGFSKGQILFFKQKGTVQELEEKIPLYELDLAIGHTRWATHGKANDLNAHPHFDALEEPELALVHNGTIHNYAHLRTYLESCGRKFVSDTDTEVVAKLIKENYQNDLAQAFAVSLKQLEGSFAIVAIHKDHPDLILAAVRECPLAIGWNQEKKEHWISSDPNAFFGRDLSVTFLENDQIALVTKGNLQVFDQNLEPIKHKKVPFSAESLPAPSKEGFEHYMLKEIFEQPKVMERMLQKWAQNTYLLSELIPYTKQLAKVDQIILLGCGTSWHAAKLAADLLEDVTQISSRAEIASEFRYRSFVLSKNALVIAISQSGETADTIAALRKAKKKGFRTLSICNVNYSTLVREADHTLLLEAGPEISVCSTKAFTSQITMLTMFCFHLARLQNRRIRHEKVRIKALQSLPCMMREILKQQDSIRAIAKKYAHYEKWIFLGRGYMYSTCLESSLKLKEISYKMANGYPAGELKHGPIALIDSSLPVVAFCANQKTHAQILNNILEVKARGGPILAIISAKDTEVRSVADDTIVLPDLDDWSSIFLATIAGQLLAYEIANICNQMQANSINGPALHIDRPRNLAKCVSVE